MSTEPIDPAVTGEVTRLLGDLRDGDEKAGEQLVPLVYREMKRIAGHLLGNERAGHTLKATDLVHEAYLRLFRRQELDWTDKSHFLRSAAIAMRRILVDHARRKKADKRIPPGALVAIEDSGVSVPEKHVDILALDQALVRLADYDGRQAQVVELRYFGGLTEPEVSKVLGVSRMTVARDWKAARLWLYREMSP